MMKSEPLQVPKAPSATVILLRESKLGFEALLTQRARELAFHGGAWVFPGGRVEAEELDPADDLGSARRAAVRETAEEAGVDLDSSVLLPFSHWTTPDGLPRRFTTWFFLASVPPDVEVRVDGRESLAHRWLAPQKALQAQAGGEMDLPPPTFVTLSVLSGFASVSELFRHAQAETPEIFVPRPRGHASGIVSLYQGDAAYESGELEQAGLRHRLCMFRSGWRYERSF